MFILRIINCFNCFTKMLSNWHTLLDVIKKVPEYTQVCIITVWCVSMVHVLLQSLNPCSKCLKVWETATVAWECHPVINFLPISLLALCWQVPVVKDSEVSLLITGKKLQGFCDSSFSTGSTVQETGTVGLISYSSNPSCGKDGKAPSTPLCSLMLPTGRKLWWRYTCIS